MLLRVGSALLFLAMDSNVDFDSSDEWEALQSEEIEEMDYSSQLDYISGQLIIIIFALGVVSGLIFSRVMWGRVK